VQFEDMLALFSKKPVWGARRTFGNQRKARPVGGADEGNFGPTADFLAAPLARPREGFGMLSPVKPLGPPAV